MALQNRAVGVELDQLLRQFAEGFLDPLLGLFPGGAAELVKPRAALPSARILLDKIQPVNGKVELVPALVLDQEKIMLFVPQGKLEQTPIDSDPVVGMNHIIFQLQLAEGPRSRGL